ncbi:DUF6162 family protein [Phytopseudomonas dryadis]|uniref:Periplasmic protein n=1 Tax=Phytopseudomonas dryadis TaxID=2487520 RepID=A0A4Q9QZ49_9GAMM|nr:MULTISPECIES: DUF6162 family protein [Pseudomonas]TBU90600.1 hypothetical protein DNK44_15325 [Pseudomonas dryadis]TBV03773.1 hypothetical protein DNK34_15705 [Pseudomonas dryadis]TBV15990.1 hypothetical protein DNK41_16270 [Pseudomonas sp. FRB 230]
MTVQVVRPAGAGHETLYVLLLCLGILLAAGSVVAWHGESETVASVESHQIDARRDLSAAEQGIYADLRVAFDEIQARRDEEQTLLAPEELAAEGFPPFADDASAINRGQHRWHLLQPSGTPAYFGASQAPAVAGSFVMLLDAADAAAPQADIWLNRDSDPGPPAGLDAQSLIDAGWQQIASQYDAGVTRQHRH